MGLLRFFSVLLLGLSGARAVALDWEFALDTRVVAADATPSFLDGGLGKFRYDDKFSAHLGRARLGLLQHVGDTIDLHLQASAWGDSNRNPIDLDEAYAEYRPYPHGAWRTRLRGGVFYAPISLENRAAGWETPYTINPSALNTWIGEEIRSVGFEGQLDWLGTQTGSSVDAGLVAGVFGWNDPAGVLIASHGFGLHDRQTSVFGRVGLTTAAPVQNRVLFREIDHRAGYYGGFKLRYLDRVELRALHYNNNADPAIFDPVINDYAWCTIFDSAGLRVESQRGWTFMTQWLDGVTYIEPEGMLFKWKYRSAFALLSKELGDHRVSVRVENFHVWETANAFGPGLATDDGTAWTIAYSYAPASPWRFAAELTRVRSDNPGRFDLLGSAPIATESKLELSIRYTFNGALHAP